MLYANINLPPVTNDLLAFLFNEEPGAVIQIQEKNKARVIQAFINAGLFAENVIEIGKINGNKEINLSENDNSIYSRPLLHLHQLWSSTSYHMQSLRDNPACADEEFARLQDASDPGLSLDLTFALDDSINLSFINEKPRPKLAVLREQGVNGQVEMAAAFDRAGFDCIDVHMNDLLNEQQSLQEFIGLVACGGFSYGDVLGAGGARCPIRSPGC